jgi:Uri superfamily endonuclease
MTTRNPLTRANCLQRAGQNEGIPTASGAYVLFITVSQDLELEIGRIGSAPIPAGSYAYAGSARGPGGLRARLGRHLVGGRATFWHIDYLLRASPVDKGMAFVGDAMDECQLVQRLLTLPGSSTPVAGFGSSDCRQGCPAHLLRIWSVDALAELQRLGGILVTPDRHSDA